jgi:hypothetical protein
MTTYWRRPLARHAGCGCPLMPLSAGAGFHSCGVHCQVQLDLGAEAPGPLANAEGPSIQHPPSSHYQPVAAARQSVDLQVEFNQACGACGGEGRHDPPGAVGQDFQAFAVSVHHRGPMTSTTSGPRSMASRSASPVSTLAGSNAMVRTGRPDGCWKRMTPTDGSSSRWMTPKPCSRAVLVQSRSVRHAKEMLLSAGSMVDGPCTSWKRMRSVDSGDPRFAALVAGCHDSPEILKTVDEFGWSQDIGGLDDQQGPLGQHELPSAAGCKRLTTRSHDRPSRAAPRRRLHGHGPTR